MRCGAFFLKKKARMDLFLRALGKYKKESILAPLLKMTEALLDLIVPLIMADIIDKGIPAGDKSYIMTRCGILVAIGLVGLTISITAQYFAAKAAVGSCTEIRHELFDRITAMEYRDLDALGTGTLTTRMTSDVTQLQNAINLTLRLLLRAPFIVIGSAVMAFRVNAGAALIFCAAIPLLAVVIFGIMQVTRRRYRSVQGKLDELSGFIHEDLTGVRVIRAFGRTRREETRFKEGNAVFLAEQESTAAIAQLMNPLTLVIVNLAIAAVLIKSGKAVNIGVLTGGAVIALVNYMSQILIELVKLANLIVQISRGLASSDRINEILRMEMKEETGTVREDGSPSAPAVEFRDVSFTYPGSRENSLSDITFSVSRGETVGIIGGTGSGKTTLGQLLPGFYGATAGEVRIFGRNISDYDTRYLRKLIHVVPQKARLFKGTVRSNLRLGDPEAADFEMWTALECAQAAGFVREKAGGLDAVVEEAGRNFSGGQRQRLTIARALVGEPGILIMDDSASALDFATDAALRRAISELPGDMTVFIISQRVNSIMNADRIIVLDDGQMAGMGTHAELMEGCDIYRDIVSSQESGEGR